MTPWGYAAALREAGTRQRWTLVALVVLALHPSLWAIYRFFMIETLLLPLTGLALWASVAAWRRAHGGFSCWRSSSGPWPFSSSRRLLRQHWSAWRSPGGGCLPVFRRRYWQPHSPH
ncbi:hypothetical protein E6W36_02480 [Hankyongella ginsenosidimutans]|uniref:Uncharacterized protein n=1 Tax=Hankyongella ginsenosidimutans TaxID=1763828 RepID=A0A4D7C5H0_9SPHN|nr:hypothetical protein E6W36_02480 [Hankyongella ginsenosidimutans]